MNLSGCLNACCRVVICDTLHLVLLDTTAMKVLHGLGVGLYASQREPGPQLQEHLFCRCNKRITGYDHFGSGSCVLFDPEEVARWQAMMRAMGEEM